MTGSATISGNTAFTDGGGIFSACASVGVCGTLIGAVAGINVVHNIPNDLASDVL